MTKKGIMMKTLLLVGVLSLASIQAHALADGPSCAVVKRTPDGFLNLRAVFNGPIIAKLRPGDLLYVMGSEVGISTLGDWAQIYGVLRLDGSKPRQDGAGWVARRFIREIKCPAKMQAVWN